MTFRADYHIHLHGSPCTSGEMTAAAVLCAAESCGLMEVGLVNHLHLDTDMDVFRRSRAEVEAYAGRRPATVLLGAEVDLLDQNGNTSLRDEIVDMVDFITLAPGHQQLDSVTCDLTLPPGEFLERETCSIIAALNRCRFDMVVHPYIYAAFPKLAPHYVSALVPGSMPQTLIDELAATLVARNTAFEYHCRDIVVRPESLGGEPFVSSYMELLNGLRKRGVRFIVGSDAHRLNQISRTAAAPDWARNALFNA